MNEQRTEITFSLLYNGEEQTVKTYAHAYRNLMVLISNTVYLDYFGECGGMGRCGTCLVKILHTPTDLSLLDRNEKATLYKTGVSDPAVRLSCQLLITDFLQGAVIEILNEG